MSSTSTVSSVTSRTRHSRWLEILTRTGFVGYGLFHLAIGWLAIQVASHRATAEADQSGALQVLGRQPLGHALLVVIAVGLAAMAFWQLTLAIGGHQTYSGGRRTAERVVSVGRVLVYTFLMWTDIQVLSQPATSSAQSQQNATAGVLAHPSGRALVAIAGIAVLALGVGMAVYGAKMKFKSKLSLAGAPARQGILRLGQFGYVARGVAFSIVGGLLLKAAVSNGAQESRGLDGALHTLAGQPYGTLALIVIAVGFMAFGVYCFCQAKYRKV